jgi:S-adenosylmethionine:tRNA ribosyltransferase-isomerase
MVPGVDPDLLLSSYDYLLPQERIAQQPAEPRHSARMLVVEPGSGVRHCTVWDLSAELRAGDLLVVNDTRVLKARLRARRTSGGAVELLVLERWTASYGASDWLCLVRPAKRVRPGEVLWLEREGQAHVQLPEQAALGLLVVAVDEASGGRVLRFPEACVDGAAIEQLLETYGEMPLPPYIQGHRPEDEQRYQTRFASRPGAVAAPTAGLHLSDALLEALTSKGVELATVTLHVGLGTFRPLEQEDLSTLALHREWVELSPRLVEAVEACRRRGGRVLAVGTTTVRSLEGVAALHGGRLQPYAGPVQLVIQPGFRFAVVQGLLTNFHLPKSSLLLLVSALIGRERLLALYALAIEEQYRFYSYGDALWIGPEAVVKGD